MSLPGLQACFKLEDSDMCSGHSEGPGKTPDASIDEFPPNAKCLGLVLLLSGGWVGR